GMASRTQRSAKVEQQSVDRGLLLRILEEGYGPGAWHGANMKVALDDVSPELAYRRPDPERHNIAEIALHHAYSIRGVRGKLSGEVPDRFVMEGDDWFSLSTQVGLTWSQTLQTLELEQRRLVSVI